MKRIYAIIYAVIVLAMTACNVCPDVITIRGDRLHVQGIALDRKEKCMYCSFTSAFYKTDLKGNIIGSVTGINGHLGAMTFDPEGRRIYASLEIKDDAIGQGVSDAIGAKRHEKDHGRFYIAEFDVDRICGTDSSFEDVVTLHPVTEAAEDYLATVEMDGKIYGHRYGCSGIDGITIGPEVGSKSSAPTRLYVAYGVYGDTLRCDNDHNILLCYRLDDLKTPEHKYFVHTGNTRYGVQNLAYDPHTHKMFMAVYKGRKSKYPNHRLFALDMGQSPFRGPLEDVPYEDGPREQLTVCGGWDFKWGSTGLCPLGDGRWYISENSKVEGQQICNATMYIWQDGPVPFRPSAKP